MLTSLHIENIAVIKCMDLDLRTGFTVLTGETGAGKSMIIDAIGLLMGGKVQKDLIRSGEEQAMVSGLFCDLSDGVISALEECGAAPDEDGVLLLQRTVTADGKSKVRLNGRSISVSLLRQISTLLLDIHGQHDNQRLLDPTSHLPILDDFAGNADALARYRAVYEQMCAIKREMTDLARDEREKERTVELLKYQIADIDAVRPRPDEEDELEARRRRIRDGEKIRKNAGLVSRALWRNEKGMSASDLLAKAASAMKTLEPYLPEAIRYAEKLEEYRWEISDMGQTASELLGEEDGEAELDRIEERLHALAKLRKKYGADMSQVLAFREKAAAELANIEGADERLEELRTEWKHIYSEAEMLARELSVSRSAAASELEQSVLAELRFLEMPKVRFHIAVRSENEAGKTVFKASGADNVEFLISANPGEPLKPLDRIASGGELSRIMLAIKSAGAGKDRNGTMIFDEIDTGVSGKTSQKIGIRLRMLGEQAQVFCITHSAQIAAVAHNQLLIRKEENDGRVETSVTMLGRQDRVREIARIMGGAQITKTLLDSAEELLSEYNP